MFSVVTTEGCTVLTTSRWIVAWNFAQGFGNCYVLSN